MESNWLENCLEGDPVAIEKMVQTFQKDVYHMALSILDDPDEAEDCAQETFLAVLRSFASYRGDASFKTWLLSITINVCRSRLRGGKYRSRLQQIVHNLFQLHGEQEHLEKTTMQNETNSELWYAIGALGIKHRIPIVLRYYHDLPVADIAALLNIPAGTVHSRLNQAREKLRTLVKDE